MVGQRLKTRRRHFVKGKKEGVETAWNKDGSVKNTSTDADDQAVKLQELQ